MQNNLWAEGLARLANLLRWLPAEDRYTYVDEGNSAVLDHILVSPALAKSAKTEIEIVHRHAMRQRVSGRRGSGKGR